MLEAFKLPLVKFPPFIVKAPTVCVVPPKSTVPVLLIESTLVVAPKVPLPLAPSVPPLTNVPPL